MFQVACFGLLFKIWEWIIQFIYLDCELQLVNSVVDSHIILFICFISIGHLLGLSHDDSKFCEENFGSMEDKRLMSSILTSIDASKPWSKCTSATITEFFDDGHGMYYHTLCQLHVSFYSDLLFLIRTFHTSLFIHCSSSGLSWKCLQRKAKV